MKTAHAFGLSIPQPAGLSPQLILSLAQKRYSTPADDKRPMHGKVAVITGAAGGIGRELSKVVHNLGGTVIAMDRNETGLGILQDSLGSNNERILCIPTQHEDLASVANSAEEIKSRYGTIDLLVNNAGLTYPLSFEPGDDRMKSKNGYDLAFTVNYLSHFLLVEKLMPCLRSSSCGRIVHLTSSFHWKVDGSELIPIDDMAGPMAYQSDPSLMSEEHVGRSYANTKLAQIWHSRSIKGCSSVCACPTWVGTGIAGEEARSFLESMAFPVAGAGIASALNAMFRSDMELGDALNDGKSYVANSRVLEYLPAKSLWASGWAAKLGWRDGFAEAASFILLLGQRFTFEQFLIQRSSTESYSNTEGKKALREWSLKEVEQWL